MKTLIIFLFALFSVNMASSQEIVKGQIVDGNGSELPGVSIVVKGTTVGTLTDIDGVFSLREDLVRFYTGAVPQKFILQFSFVGMKTVEYPFDPTEYSSYKIKVVLYPRDRLRKYADSYVQILESKAVSPSIAPVTAKDDTPPEITLYEPSVSRGMKMSDEHKQILVKGRATDLSGIYEITINGVEANVGNNGNFEQNVALAIGENTILIKATDTRNNSNAYSFYVNRQSNVMVARDVNPPTVNEKRLALVIGNANYTGGQTLKNPVNDANLMASTLQNLGFEVIKTIDANKQQMEKAIRDFSRKLPNSNVALFYYAGHGLQIDGENYLLPTDAQVLEKSDCKFEAVSVNFVVEEFEQYPDKVNIVILDACRSNPFRSWARGGERGFKAISPSSGTIISFATSEGSTASDGTGNNGIFTEELVKQMTVSQPIESVFKKTRVLVQKRSNFGQSPQEWSQLTGDFYFVK